MQSVLRTASRSRQLATSSRRATQPLPFRSQFIRTLITKRYTAEHETVSFDDTTGVGTVTITDHAQSVLGDVVFVELPAVGTEIAQGEQIGAVESVKAASDIYAPVSGTIEEINETLSEQPGLLNKSAEDRGKYTIVPGWLCKIKLSDPSQMDKLLSEEAYKATYQV